MNKSLDLIKYIKESLSDEIIVDLEIFDKNAKDDTNAETAEVELNIPIIHEPDEYLDGHKFVNGAVELDGDVTFNNSFKFKGKNYRIGQKFLLELFSYADIHPREIKNSKFNKNPLDLDYKKDKRKLQLLFDIYIDEMIEKYS